jgi:DNA-binding response OmpR family regulator
VPDVVAAGHRLDVFRPDLLVLDPDTDDSNGYAFISQTRAHSAVQIVALSSGGTEDVAVAALRRVESSDPSDIEIAQLGALRVDFQQRRVQRDGQAVHLTPTEYRLLELFARHPGTLVAGRRAHPSRLCRPSEEEDRIRPATPDLCAHRIGRWLPFRDRGALNTRRNSASIGNGFGR